MTDEKTEISKTYRHTGTIGKQLRATVRTDEKAAAKELGGPVKRSHTFINGGDDIVITWRRA